MHWGIGTVAVARCVAVDFFGERGKGKDEFGREVEVGLIRCGCGCGLGEDG